MTTARAAFPPPDVIPLRDVPRRLRDAYAGAVPDLRDIWDAALRNRFPTTYRRISPNRRWWVAENDIPEIARHFGLAPRSLDG